MSATEPTSSVVPLEGRLVLSVPEAAKVLGISRAHAYELVTRGQLPNLRLGRRVVVPTRALLDLVGRVQAPTVIAPARLGRAG